MGSGTTGVVCVICKAFIGIERERKYFITACRRIEQAYAQPRLFEDAKPAEAVVGDMLCLPTPGLNRLAGFRQSGLNDLLRNRPERRRQ